MTGDSKVNVKTYMVRSIMYAGPLVSFLLLGLLLNTTSPTQSGPAIILLIFVVFYLLVATTLSLILHVVGAVVRMFLPGRVVSLKEWYYVVSVVALAPVLFVALNTLGQFGLLEAVLILLFVILGSFYVVRRTSK